MDEPAGEEVTFDRTLEIICIILESAFTNSEVCPWIGYYADNCSMEKVWIILVPFRFYDQMMRILSALLYNLWMEY